MKILKLAIAHIKSFLASVEGSVKGSVSFEELYRSILTAVGSGSMIGAVTMLVQTILADVPAIFPNPIVSSLASLTLTLVLDLLRRMNQGNTPTPTPSTPSA